MWLTKPAVGAEMTQAKKGVSELTKHHISYVHILYLTIKRENLKTSHTHICLFKSDLRSKCGMYCVKATLFGTPFTPYSVHIGYVKKFEGEEKH